MRSIAIIVGLAASAATAAVLPNQPVSAAPLPMGEIGWEGVVIPGQPAVEVWGATFEDIEAKIRKEYNPEFSIYSEEIVTPPSITENPALLARKHLETRQTGLICNEYFGSTSTYYAEQARDNLRRISGNRCKARARTCIRMQCVQYAAITTCNDQWNKEVDVHCGMIADFADRILYAPQCFRHAPVTCDAQNNCNHSPLGHESFGQIFANDRSWNVIISSCARWGSGERPVKARELDAPVIEA
ncbi:hypothetical protein B0T11DRAFT_333580 [Plectosphaerella cucumerina]|uniref:Secreted protein n=1 Tax=Plectosphaerella cucumerina TaxID=40658 RepID=A0A8K0T4L6_9PEZI|nr:hypothetical protein B0T11DRAFT_333580 [Plectosphaerella cucumerina]